MSLIYESGQGVQLALLGELLESETVAVGVLFGDFWPLVDAVEHCDCHAAEHMCLNVAVEEEGPRVDNLIA